MNERIVERLTNNLNTPECKEFLKKRHFDESFVKLMHLGFISEDLVNMQFTKQTQADLALTHQGKFRYKSHLLFPCYTYSGDFCGFIGRATFETPFKYQLPEHILFSKETYIHRWNDTPESSDIIFVSENMVEAGRIAQCGLPSVSLNGAYQSQFKLSVLANRFKKVIVVADNDAAGYALKSFIKEYLGDLNREVSIVEHQEKGLDEYFIKNGLEQTKKLLDKYA